MRIAIWHNLPSGGGKRALYYHVKGLVERGHHVEVWAPSTADQSYLPLSALCQEHVLPLSIALGTSAGGWRDPYDRVRALLSSVDRHCRACAEQITAAGFDVLFANSCMFVAAPPIARYVDLPSVLYLGEPNRLLYEAWPTLPWLAIRDPTRFWWSPRYLSWFLRDAVRVQALRVQAREESVNARAFERILVNSYFSRETVLRVYGVDATLCYLGIDTERFRDNGQQREDFLLSVGALVQGKNAEFVIRAVAEVPPPRPTLVWVANASNDPYLAKLRALARTLHVDFRPLIGISDGELVRMYSTASVMVYAPRLEPFGFVPLEAGACSLPVVATAEGGVRETVVDGVSGLLVDHDTKSFATALQRLTGDRSYAQQLGEAGRRLVEQKWSLEAAIDRLEFQLCKAGDRQPTQMQVTAGG